MIQNTLFFVRHFNTLLPHIRYTMIIILIIAGFNRVGSLVHRRRRTHIVNLPAPVTYGLAWSALPNCADFTEATPQTLSIGSGIKPSKMNGSRHSPCDAARPFSRQAEHSAHSASAN